MSNLMKICPMAAESFHTGGSADRHDEANNRFPKCCERP